MSAVLALPRATTVLFVVLLASMLAAALFVGTALHNVLLGDAWSAAWSECLRTSTQAAGGPAEQQGAQLACMQPAEQRRAGISALTTAAVVLLGLGVVLAGPAMMMRRHRLRAAEERDEPAVARVAKLAVEAGLRTPPAVVRGTARLRGAFSFGRPGDYRIAVPTAVLIRPRGRLFDPLVRHELAHIAHRDVALSTLAGGVWWALTPLLLAPAVAGLVVGEPEFVPDYLWRAVLVAVVVAVVRRAVLRAREFDADLAAVARGSDPEVRDLVARIRAPRGGALHRLRATHPDAASREAVLDDPITTTAMGWLDGLTIAFLATLAYPVLRAVVIASRSADPATALLAPTLAALLVGALLGGTIGLGLWRRAAAARIAGVPLRVAPVALGAAVGCLLGQVASLAGTALPGLGGHERPLTTLIPAVAVAGATVAAGGLGSVWVAAARRPPSARLWTPAVLLSAVVFAVALRSGDVLAFASEQGGWPLAWFALQNTLTGPVPSVIAVILAGVAAVALVRGRPGFGEALTTGVASGLAAAAALIFGRLVVGVATTPSDGEARLYALVAAAAVAGAVAAVVLGLARGPHGAGAGVLAAGVAAATTAVGFIALNTALGGDLAVGFVVGILQRCLAVGLVVLLLSLWLAAVPLPRAPRRGIVPAAAIVLTLLLAGGAFVGRSALTTPMSLEETARPPDAVVADYRERVAPALLGRRVVIQQAFIAIDGDPSASRVARAQRVDREVLVPMRVLLQDAQAYVVSDPRIMTVHADLVSSLQYGITAFEEFRSYYLTAERAAIDRGRFARSMEVIDQQTWMSGVESW